MVPPDIKEVIYDSVHWMVLKGLREKAIKIMDALATRSLSSAVYGSVARGDVNKKSDIDVIIPYTTSSHTVELALQMGGLQFFSRRIAQATPREFRVKLARPHRLTPPALTLSKEQLMKR